MLTKAQERSLKWEKRFWHSLGWVLLAVLFCFIAFAFYSMPAKAEIGFTEDGQYCASTRAELVADLKQRWNEQPIALGENAVGTASFELFFDFGDRSWTVIATAAADGTACVLATGVNWRGVFLGEEA